MTHIWWYLARATGIVASVLVAAAVIWGLLLSTRVLQNRPRPAWLLDLHRMLGGLAVAFVAIHVATLMADSYVEFGFADVLVPFASGWRTGAVAFGILAMYLLVVVELTSLAMRKLPRRWWHGIHLSSYVCFWFVAVHGALAGSDADNLWFRWGSIVAIVVVAVLTVYRAVMGRRARKQRPRPAPPTPAPPTPAPPARVPVAANAVTRVGPSPRAMVVSPGPPVIR